MQTNDDLFSNDIPGQFMADVDILALDYCESDQQLASLTLKVGSTAGIENLGQLKRRLLEYIHVLSLGGKPSKLQTLNRRFGRLAVKYSTSIRSLIEYFHDMKQIQRIDVYGAQAFCTKRLYDINLLDAESFLESLRAKGRQDYNPVEEFLQRMIDNAQ